MTSTKQLKLGVLGLGEGRSVISAALQSPLWEIGNVCDLNENLCRERCREFGLQRWTAAYQDLLDDKAIDVVGIYTPDRFHADHVLMALDAGKHVICTKPLFVDLARAREVYDRCRNTGRHVFVGQSTRFFESMMRQREDYEAGRLGELITVEAHYHADHRWFLKKAMTDPGSFKWLYGAISHPADLVRWYMPEIEEVMGYGNLSANGRSAGLTHHDSMHFVMKDRNGRIARVSGNYSSPCQPSAYASHMSCVLRCEGGASQADYPDLRYARTSAGAQTVEHYESKAAYYWRFHGHSHHAGEYQNYLEYFAKCVTMGISPKPDIREGIETVALMNAMDKALETGRPVKVREMLDPALRW